MSTQSNLGTAPVDVALVLAVDCSSSVDAGDFGLQMQGTAKALRYPPVLDAIAAGPFRRIAVCMVHWSSRNSQVVAVPWHGLSISADIDNFAHQVETVDRHWQPGGTGLAAAMNFCVSVLINLPITAAARVIDISGDGADNENGDLTKARNKAIANNFTINGLPILYGQQHIEDYYRANVICGPEAFLMPTQTLQSYTEVLQKKLLRELQSRSV